MDFRKTLKVLAVLSIIGGILGIIFGGLAALGGGAVTAMSGNEEVMSQISGDEEVAQSIADFNAQAGTDLTAEQGVAGAGILIVIVGILSFISGIFEILMGIFGLKAVNGKGAGPAFVIGIITLVFNVISLVAGGGRNIIGGLISVALAGLYVYCAKSIKDEEAAASSDTFTE